MLQYNKYKAFLYLTRGNINTPETRQNFYFSMVYGLIFMCEPLLWMKKGKQQYNVDSLFLDINHNFCYAKKKSHLFSQFMINREKKSSTKLTDNNNSNSQYNFVV
jgi:hypothetical protein